LSGASRSTVRGGRFVASAAVGLDLTDPLAQRLGMHAEIGRDMRDRTLALQRKPDRPPHQLLGVLLRSSHGLESFSSRQDIILASRPPSNRDGSHGQV
jgi:hypothetical protein